MANTYLEKQTALAKKIRKTNPKLSWIDAVKKAAAELKSGKKVGAYKVIEKGETPKTKVKAVYQITRNKKGTFKSGGVKRVAGLPKVAGVNTSNELFNTSNKLMEYEKDILEAKNKLKLEKLVVEKNKIKAYIKNRNNQYIALKKYLNTLARFR